MRKAMTEAQARKQAKREKEFYGHLASYLICNAFFAALNLLTSPGAIWFIFPMLGWGIGLASHAVSVFGLPGKGREWESRRVKELMADAVSDEHVRTLLDKELARREPRRRAGESDNAARLRERIEHLEAIVTSRDWDEMEKRDTAPASRAIDVDASDEEGSEAQAARLARRVR